MLSYSVGQVDIVGYGNELVIITDNLAYVVADPFLSHFSVETHSMPVRTLGGHVVHQVPTHQEVSISMVGGAVDIVQGDNLHEKFDPVLKKSVLELMQIVNHKLKERK